jgi:hypothetical protein
MQGVYELLKTQMLLSMNNPVIGVATLTAADILNRTFPTWSAWSYGLCCSRRPTKSASHRTPRATITCERGAMTRSAQTQTLYQTRMDAVVHAVTNRPTMDSLLSVTHHDYLPNAYEPISIGLDVTFELMDLQVVDGHPSIVKFRLMAYEHDVQHLQSFIDTCTAAYERSLANKLGSARYFFDQVIQSKIKGSTQNTLPNSHLLYTKSKFTTTRSFQNVFFDDRVHVQARTRFFLEERAWYESKGIPYTLGFLFHGPPGTGKTSTIKAIAGEGNRHIVNVQLSEIKTKAQLQHLFFNDEIHVYNGATTEKYIIPVSERVYVIEDIDAMGDIVLRREWKTPATPSTKPKSEEDAWLDRQKDSEKETIDLSFLLNLLDGTLEANGRILILTTNFPERIDRALIRPGRVDMIVSFKTCSRVVMQEMVSAFYDDDIPLPDDPTLDGKWTPAEVNQILFRNVETPTAAVADLVTLTRADLGGVHENGSSGTGVEIASL